MKNKIICAVIMATLGFLISKIHTYYELINWTMVLTVVSAITAIGAVYLAYLSWKLMLNDKRARLTFNVVNQQITPHKHTAIKDISNRVNISVCTVLFARNFINVSFYYQLIYRIFVPQLYHFAIFVIFVPLSIGYFGLI